MHSALLTILFAASSQALPSKIPTVESPLQRHAIRRNPLSLPNGDLDEVAFLQHLTKTLRKYSDEDVPEFPGVADAIKLRKRGAGSLALAAQDGGGYDLLYYGQCSIRDQGWLFDFDTGSADIFVPGPNCGPGQGCNAGQRYDGKGTPLGNTTSITYGSGSATGDIYLDDVSCGGLTANGINVISSTTESGFTGFIPQGLLGLASSAISRANPGYPNFFEKLMDQGKVAAREFSFYFGRIASGTQGNSEVVFGGRNPAKFTGSLSCLPVTNQGYWQVAFDGFRVSGGGLTLPLIGSLGLLGGLSALTIPPLGDAIIDTGTSIALVPTAVGMAIHQQIPKSIPLTLANPGSARVMTVWAIPCDTKKIISFVAGGKEYTFNPLDYNIGKYGIASGGLLQGLLNLPYPDGMCLSSFVAGDTVDQSLNRIGQLSILGDTLLKSWYSVFTYKDGRTLDSVCLGKAV